MSAGVAIAKLVPDSWLPQLAALITVPVSLAAIAFAVVELGHGRP